MAGTRLHDCHGATLWHESLNSTLMTLIVLINADCTHWVGKLRTKRFDLINVKGIHLRRDNLNPSKSDLAPQGRECHLFNTLAAYAISYSDESHDGQQWLSFYKISLL
jgi:hypothetical protein